MMGPLFAFFAGMFQPSLAGIIGSPPPPPPPSYKTQAIIVLGSAGVLFLAGKLLL